MGLLIKAGQKGIGELTNRLILPSDNTVSKTNKPYYTPYDNLPDYNPQTGEKIDKQSYYDKLVNGEDVEKPKNFTDIYFDVLSNKRGVPSKKLHDSMVDFSRWISMVESRNNNNARPGTTTAKGFFQFTDDSEDTARQRLRNVSKRIKAKMSDNIKSFADGKKSITDLSYDEQQQVFFVNFAEDRDSKITDLFDKKNYEIQYAFHHRDKGVMKHYKDTGSIDYNKASDRNIQDNLNNVRGIDYNAEYLKNNPQGKTVKGF